MPVYRSDAPSSMEAGDGAVPWIGQVGLAGPDPKTLEMRGGDTAAVAASHQHAILGLAQIRNAHG